MQYGKVIVLIILPVFLYFIPLEWLNQQHPVCLFKNLFGTECYGCGLTRAVLSAIQFDYIAAYHYNRFIVAVFPLLGYVWIREIVRSIRLLYFLRCGK